MIVDVVMEVQQEQRLLYLDRGDLRFVVKAAVPSEGKKTAIAKLTGLGHSIISASFLSKEHLRVIIRPPLAERTALGKEHVFRPNKGKAPRLVNSAGRTRNG